AIKIMINFKGVSYLSVSGLRLLIKIKHELLNICKENPNREYAFILTNLNEGVKKIFQNIELEDYFDIFEDTKAFQRILLEKKYEFP
ncbi:MAG: STAS domain-containing protein, partial [Actinomycetia bacterium]|nr:STAS domain-containing protein [Actinomycetes bacterium]